MSRRRVAVQPWPLESRQVVADYLDKIRGYSPGVRWDRQEDPPVAPCIVCGAERWAGKVCCGTVTPPARPDPLKAMPWACRCPCPDAHPGARGICAALYPAGELPGTGAACGPCLAQAGAEVYTLF